CCFFFFQAEDGIRDKLVTGVQTCALPIYPHRLQLALAKFFPDVPITVVNKGVPRQSTRQMVGRFATDVIPEDPILVVWETGISRSEERRVGKERRLRWMEVPYVESESL